MQDKQLRAQIEAITSEQYSVADIEDRIADGLVENGRFHATVNDAELEIILRNVVYTMFGQQKVAGMGVGLVHNVATMNVDISDGEADIDFVVHIHKPIVAFLEFQYTLINNPEKENSLTLKQGSLRINEKTRRFDLKAKAALTAMNVTRITNQELSHMAEVIGKTLPPQLEERRGVDGKLNQVLLFLNENTLDVLLEGKFIKIAADDD